MASLTDDNAVLAQISKLVLFYPAFCIPDDARAGKMIFAKFDPDNIPDIIHCGPMKLGKCYVEDVIHLEPYQEISKFQGDVLIVHGTNDKIVNVKYAEQAYAVYSEETKRNNLTRTVSFHEIKNDTHGFFKRHDAVAIDYLEQFLTLR